jgi:SPW repeat
MRGNASDEIKQLAAPRNGEMVMFKTLRWEDLTGVALGAWLIASPWVAGFSDSIAATVNAFGIGTLLVLLELMEFEQHEPAKEWIDFVVGLWLLISPTVLGFASLRIESVNANAVGLLVVLLAVWAMTPLDEKIGHWWRDHVARH